MKTTTKFEGRIATNVQGRKAATWALVRTCKGTDYVSVERRMSGEAALRSEVQAFNTNECWALDRSRGAEFHGAELVDGEWVKRF